MVKVLISTLATIFFLYVSLTGNAQQLLEDEEDGPSLLDEEDRPGLQQPAPGDPPLDGQTPGVEEGPGMLQPETDPETVQRYVIGGIEVSGNVGVSRGMIINMSGLTVGKSITVPGEEISDAIKSLWEQELFSDVSLSVDKIEGEQIFLEINLSTRDRLSGYEITGVDRRSQRRSIEDKLDLERGDVITDFFLSNIDRTIRDYYKDKGYPETTVDISKRQDTIFEGNSQYLNIDVRRGQRVKIKDINFYGNEEFSDWRLRWMMDETKQRQRLNFFRTSKFEENKFEEDKKKIIRHYRNEGYRDAYIERDSVYRIDENLLAVDIHIDEGNKYYFRDITWRGNTKYDDEVLSSVLGINKGDVYSPDRLQRRLVGGAPQGNDVSALYMDDGHLFFNAEPNELRVENDSVDIQVQLREGPQAVIDEVTFTGNTKTNDHVILREIRTRPGKKFSRSDVVRSQRELAQLGYFDPEQMDIVPQPNPEEGTVDIEYKLVEQESDQVELSGGYGQNQLVFTLGLEFNNFSLRSINDRDAWQPLPTGDGQKLRLRAQSNGRYFQSYNFSFTEPWFGGRRPNSFNFSVFHSFQSQFGNRQNNIQISGVTAGLSKRLSIPDDYFTLSNRVTVQRYNLNNYGGIFTFNEGSSNNLSFEHKLSRNSIDAPIYPRRGSRMSLSFQWTPPYSLFDDRDPETLTPQEQFKWLEFHKWRFESSWFFNLTDKLVVNARADFGILGRFNRDRGISPFERFYVGGDGLSGYNIDGRELIRLRGYDDQSITPTQNNERVGGNIFNKFTFELRYPLSLNPNATIFLLGFAEAGNNWLGLRQYDPFDAKRSAGGGVRVFLPMFGMLGLDMGYRFDDLPGVPGSSGQWEPHISIGQEF